MQELINMFKAVDALAVILPLVGSICAIGYCTANYKRAIRIALGYNGLTVHYNQIGPKV